MRLLLIILLLFPTPIFALDWMGGDQSTAWFGETTTTSWFGKNTDRIIVFYTDNCPPCVVLKKKLEKPFSVLRSAGWKIGSESTNHIQVIYAKDTELDEQLGIDSFPSVVRIENDEIVRRLDQDCGTVFDEWAFGWLAKGKQERPPAREKINVYTTKSYPVHGQRWNFEGRWNPSKSFMIRHLNSGIHRGKFNSWNLQSWSKAELWSLHDDDHEGRVKSRYRKTVSTSRVSSYCPT
ncbi:thioredoxin family protein [bacterium]|nr:thioredoxin family protein [bacterium]